MIASENVMKTAFHVAPFVVSQMHSAVMTTNIVVAKLEIMILATAPTAVLK